MADAVKAQKLAAARRRLKEYQKTQSNSKKVIKYDDDQENVDPAQKSQMVASSENVTPAESMASSTHSTLDPPMVVQENVFQNSEIDARSRETEPTSDLIVDNKTNANYFNNALFQTNASNHLLSNYFDAVSVNSDSSNLLNAFTQNFATTETIQPNVNEHFVGTESKQFHFAETVDKNNQNTMYADPFDLPVEQGHRFVPTNDYMTTIKTELQSSENAVPTQEIQNVETTKQTQIYSEKQLTPERKKSECALPENLQIDSNANQNTIFSNTESLRQLSSQLNSLIDSDTTQNVTETSELEKRNQELASLLKNEQLKTEQLNLQLREYMTRITQLETESQQLKNEHDVTISRETGPLQEQLQCHVQTVGILVGEKTELTMALNQSQTTAKQKTSECEELQGRLKASRHRVSELEKEVNFLKSTKDNFDKHEQENNREFERLRLEYNLLKDQFQETSEETSELREKLKAKMSECLSLQQDIQEKNSQLSLTQLKVQQLTSGENIQTESQLEILNQQKISLEQQISELTQTVKVITAERDQASQQYQQYVQQLNGQIQSLAESLETKNIENDNLSKREQSLVKHIGELEKHLQHLQNERQTFAPSKHDNDAEIKKLEETINGLRNDYSDLEAKYTDELNKRNELDAQMQQKEELIFDLVAKIDQLKDQPDANKLLAAMESDKVAASRAVEQNKKLKEQLEELHDGFIKMSNSKLELTEKLQTELHQNKELSDKLTQSTAAVEHLHSVIAIKDKELTEVQTRETDLQKQILQQSQLADRLRHYEAKGNTSDFLQQDLQQAQQTVIKLTAENEMLTSKLNSDISINLPNQSTEENMQLKERVTELEKINSELTKKLNETGSEETDSAEEGKTEKYFDKENAMQQLEERFKKTMAEVAELTEEKQRLEHLVLQLQSETETIGEYVTLYQCQRAMLKEKTLEKDEQLKRLALDREEMTVKLDELNALVQKLIVEKEIIPKELLRHSLLQRNDVCEIHKQEDGLKTEENENDKGKIINGNHDNNNENFGTAGKIISLLSEIKTSNLVQPGDSIQNFHPCPWCSGQLITV